MTWLHGSTTHTALQDKLTKLIAGEVADDNSVTVPVGTAWLRDQAGEDFLSTPSGVAYTIPNFKARAGYFMPLAQRDANYSGVQSEFPSYFLASQSHHSAFCRVSTIPSALASGTRVWCQVTCTTANTVAGDYSTARFTILTYNADTAGLINNNTGLAANSAGAVTAGTPFTSGVFTVGNPDTGFVPLNATWVRCFDTTCKGGYDIWPMWKHRQNGVTSVTYATAPPGTVSTDYAIGEFPVTGASASITSTSQGIVINSIEGFYSGLGIKTQTGLGSGALYEVNGFSCCRQRIRILGAANAITSGTVDLETSCGVGLNPSSSTYMRVGGWRLRSWAQCFKTAASVAGSDTIEYYVSVKADQVVVILQGNPAAAALGKLYVGAAALAIRTDVNASDHFPVVTPHGAMDYTADNQSAVALAHAKFLLWDEQGFDTPTRDVVFGTARDWHTGWARPELWKTPCMGQLNTQSVEGSGVFNPVAWGNGVLSYVSGSLPNMAENMEIPFIQLKPNPADGKWWLYPFSMVDYGRIQQSTSFTTDPTIALKRQYRGATDDSVCFLPDTGWNTGDELYEASSGKRWLLLKPDFWGIGQPIRQAANVFYGGLAILET